MPASQLHIIERLKKEILSLQGFASPQNGQDIISGLGPINDAFPNRHFPLRAVHEFVCGAAEDRSSTTGFIAGMVSTIMRRRGVVVWVGSKLQVYPHAFNAFNIDPERIIFVSPDKEKEVLWAVEESMKCEGLSAVVGELYGLSFDFSRRLQLAVERSHVSGFIINRNARSINATACVSRWRIGAMPTAMHDAMPGPGFPRWQVELLKVRNGKSGNWQVEWKAGQFRFVSSTRAIDIGERRKTG